MRRTNSVPAHTSHAAGLLDFAFLGIENTLPSVGANLALDGTLLSHQSD
jgi:hypothetical protein